jgi:DNA-binding MarR family transcriptional regulator
MITPEELTNMIHEEMTTFVQYSMHEYNHFARSAGLSMTQMNILLHLRYQGPCEVMHLTEVMQGSPAAASQIIERMANQGLVQRSTSAQDRRVRLVRLTEAGTRLIEASIAARRQWVETLVNSLGPEQREKVAEALRLVAEKIAQVEVGELYK